MTDIVQRYAQPSKTIYWMIWFSSSQMVLQLKRWKNMWCIRTYCTAINDLSLNRNSKDNEKFDRWVKWVGNEIRVKFCLSENEMCVYGILDVHMAWKIENRMPHFLPIPSFAYICNFTCVKVSKEMTRICTWKRYRNLHVQAALNIINS